MPHNVGTRVATPCRFHRDRLQIRRSYLMHRPGLIRCPVIEYVAAILTGRGRDICDGSGERCCRAGAPIKRTGVCTNWLNPSRARTAGNYGCSWTHVRELIVAYAVIDVIECSLNDVYQRFTFPREIEAFFV